MEEVSALMREAVRYVGREDYDLAEEAYAVRGMALTGKYRPFF